MRVSTWVYVGLRGLMTDQSCHIGLGVVEMPIRHQTPIQALQKWRTEKPDLFVKRVYKQTGLDTRLHASLLARIFHPFFQSSPKLRFPTLPKARSGIRGSPEHLLAVLPGPRRNCPTPPWVAGHICVNTQARRWGLDQGERNWRIACAKTSALGQLEARYRRIRRVLRVTTAATLSSFTRSVST